MPYKVMDSTVKSSNMYFDEAFSYLRQGLKNIARDSWGKETFITLYKIPNIIVLTNDNNIIQKEYQQSNDKKLFTPESIYIKTNDNKFIPWTPAYDDLMASDWKLI